MNVDRREFEKALQSIMPDAEVHALGENATEIRAKNAVCDFCCERLTNDGHILPAHDAAVGDTPMGPFVSVGDWGACDACKALIDADDREALLDRYVAFAVKKYGNSRRAQARRNGRQAHATYFASRVREN